MTRDEYMSSPTPEAHRQYYGEIAEEAGVKFHPHFDQTFLDKVRSALTNGDEHLNSISLSVWENLGYFHHRKIDAAFRVRGDFWSMAGGVCVVKEAARRAATNGAMNDD